MDIALRLALRAQGFTSPNPLVGALVVKNGEIVGKGYHRKAGAPHAEIFALNQAGSQTKGATLYVTLEPCSHFGKTPPCVNRILDSGIKKVVIGIKDPNPVNNGRSIRLLRNKGINVKVGILKEELEKINEPFIKYITKKMPFITVKIAQSLDGKIATRLGDSRWITSKVAREHTHRLRKFYDAILVGINTVIKDDPQLNSPYSKRQPIKIIIDSSLKIPLKAKALRNPSSVIIATMSISSRRRYNLLRKRGLRILKIPSKDKKVNLELLFKELAEVQITNILVEGGGKIIGSLFDEKLVDKVMFVIAPKIIGGRQAVSSVEGVGIKYLRQAAELKDLTVKRLNQDLLIEGKFM
ncbi:MAG: bifunctional diaminohydroxyphosphoribosylaminopyrimidine deaminase/5-amino-6-(5-phosphoribosylamino)uracil reductase RibD [Candidatus Omnitrophica bacterium]|nr:bifunctional diaminohydroxyphosphoribosylaminopyrimidine deaminase/5-amino-6-(5-phosphoribosylamino)uracil reductase RibD [Candidatus Omnitrophota bacterium]